MIEPTEYESYVKVLETEIGEPQFIFAIQCKRYWAQIGLLRGNKIGGQSMGFHFVAVIRYDKMLYRIDNAPANKEEFLDYLQEKHPEYFDWFLFHPELL